MFSDKENGGLGIPNIEAQDSALKIVWVKRLLDESNKHCNWNIIAKSQLS